MDTSETFTLLPLSLDPASKAISTSSQHSSPSSLDSTLTTLNTLHRTLLSLPNSTTPPPPIPPSNPKRSAAIAKMRDQASAQLRKATTSGSPTAAEEAIKLYTYAYDMALSRPGFESNVLVREELAPLLASRAQAHMILKQWAEGAADGKSAVECVRGLNPQQLQMQGPGGGPAAMKEVLGKACVRRGRCLVEMGLWEEAKRWVDEVDGGEGREWEDLKKEIAEGWKKSRVEVGA